MEEHKSSTSDTLDNLSVTLTQRVSKNESDQNLFSSMPYHAAFAFLIPLLIGVLGVYAQGRKNLFETNCANIWIFLLSALFYSFALAADLKYQNHPTSYSQFFGPVAIMSGSLSSASVISILLGDFTLVIWAFVPVILAYQHATSIKNAYNLILQKIKSWTFINMPYDWLHQKIRKAISKFWGIFIRFKGSSLVEQSQLPL